MEHALGAVRTADRRLVVLGLLTALSSLEACRGPGSGQPTGTVVAAAAADASPVVSPPPPGGGALQPPSAPTSESSGYQVAGRQIILKSGGGSCRLGWTSGTGGEHELGLDLSPPCYLLLWQGTLPRAKPDRIPVGAAGDPMAFRYRERGKEEVTAIAAIGDPVPESLSKSDRVENARRLGYRCGGSAQGILFRGERAEALRKRAQVGVFCVEIPVDQASFWLTTHN